ncbi:MAG: carboxylating nicotinate-nucleotide diphosphorylase [Thermoplasmata archaeon]|nr:carboxylating nicotinate-nucleotide diphosphorylase [Thermoplasmata archaeon]
MEEMYVRSRLEEFLREDLGWGDITTGTLDLGGVPGRGSMVFGEGCVAAGLREAAMVFDILGCAVEPLVSDGDRVEAGAEALRCRGPVEALLAGERLALNLVSRMSAIATVTREAVDILRGVNPSVRVAATRKTTPGFRFFEKRAVEIGGGLRHRWRLDDMVLIKDNHIAMIGGVREAVLRAKRDPYHVVEVEVETLDMALEAVDAGADVIMLDNMAPGDAAECYHAVKERRPWVVVEVSGGITRENLGDYALCADVISASFLTLDAGHVDVSMTVEPEKDAVEPAIGSP